MLVPAIERRREVPDSEDDPMTSSPVSVSTGTADKLFAVAHVPNQDAQDAPQEAMRRLQATPRTAANITTERLDGLDADQNVASFHVAAARDEQTDAQPTTTAASPGLAENASDNAANIHHPNTASYSRLEAVELKSSQDVSTADMMHTGGLAATPEAVLDADFHLLPEDFMFTTRDETTVAANQSGLTDDKVTSSNAGEQSPHPRNASESHNEFQDEPPRNQLQADSFKHTRSDLVEVSDDRPNGHSTSPVESRTLAAPRADAPGMLNETLESNNVASVESHKRESVDQTTQQIQEDNVPRPHCDFSGNELDAKHAVSLTGVYNNTKAPATGPHSSYEDPVNKKVTLHNFLMEATSHSGVVLGCPQDAARSEDTSGRIGARATSTDKTNESHHSNPSSPPNSADTEAKVPDTTMDLHVSQPSNMVEAQSIDKAHDASSSFLTDSSTKVLTIPILREETSQNPSAVQMSPSDVAVPTEKAETEAVPQASISHPHMMTSVQAPEVSATSNSAKTPQENTLAELKAQKSALIATLAALPAIQVLVEENAISAVDMAGDDEEPTDADITAAANKIVKDHIKLLHEYNELKDVGQGLMGLIADQRGVRIIEVQEEFGIEAQD